MGRIPTNVHCRNFAVGNCTRTKCRFIHDPSKAPKKGASKPKRTCYTCGSSSHIARFCPESQDSDSNSSEKANASSSQNDGQSPTKANLRRARREARIALNAVLEERKANGRSQEDWNMSNPDEEDEFAYIKLVHIRESANIRGHSYISPYILSAHSLSRKAQFSLDLVKSVNERVDVNRASVKYPQNTAGKIGNGGRAENDALSLVKESNLTTRVGYSSPTRLTNTFANLPSTKFTFSEHLHLWTLLIAAANLFLPGTHGLITETPPISPTSGSAGYADVDPLTPPMTSNHSPTMYLLCTFVIACAGFLLGTKMTSSNQHAMVAVTPSRANPTTTVATTAAE
jgi:hypothetical protein